MSPRGLAERAEDGAAVHGTPLLAVAAEEGADSQRVWEAPEAARFKDRTHPQGPRRNRPCRHPDFAPAGPTSAQNCEMITCVALSHQVCDSVPQRPPDSPPQARTRPHPRPPLPGKDDPVLGLDGPHSSPTPTSREPGAVSVRPEGGRQHHSLRSTFQTCSGTRLYAHPRSWGSRLGRMILDQEHPSPFGKGARPASHGCHWAPPLPPIYTLLPADRPASPHLVERASSAG